MDKHQITLTFTLAEVNTLVMCLNEGPHRLVRNLIDRVTREAERQVAEAEMDSDIHYPDEDGFPRDEAA
jgi:hypothetical protein